MIQKTSIALFQLWPTRPHSLFIFFVAFHFLVVCFVVTVACVWNICASWTKWLLAAPLLGATICLTECLTRICCLGLYSFSSVWGMSRMPTQNGMKCVLFTFSGSRNLLGGILPVNYRSQMSRKAPHRKLKPKCCRLIWKSTPFSCPDLRTSLWMPSTTPSKEKRPQHRGRVRRRQYHYSPFSKLLALILQRCCWIQENPPMNSKSLAAFELQT